MAKALARHYPAGWHGRHNPADLQEGLLHRAACSPLVRTGGVLTRQSAVFMAGVGVCLFVYLFLSVVLSVLISLFLYCFVSLFLCCVVSLFRRFVACVFVCLFVCVCLLVCFFVQCLFI